MSQPIKTDKAALRPIKHPDKVYLRAYKALIRTDKPCLGTYIYKASLKDRLWKLKMQNKLR